MGESCNKLNLVSCFWSPNEKKNLRSIILHEKICLFGYCQWLGWLFVTSLNHKVEILWWGKGKCLLLNNDIYC